MEDLILSNMSYVFSAAYKLTGEKESAKELAQDALLAAWKSREQLKSPDAVKPWLSRICTNTFLMKQRRSAGKLEFPSDELDSLEAQGNMLYINYIDVTPEDELIADETVREIRNGCFRAMVQRLTLEQRVVFSLIDMFGLSIEETSKTVDLSKAAVKALLHRARINLTKFFASKCQWVNMDGTCRCRSWAEFMGKREAIRAEVKQRRLETGFLDNPDEKGLNSDMKDKVLKIYRNMPDVIPEEEWYKSVIDALGA